MHTLVAAVCGAFVLAAPAGAAPAKSACGLLTRGEVTAAIGEPLASVKGGRGTSGSTYCNWVGRDAHVLSKGITVIAATDRLPARYKAYLQALDTHRPVAGVGTAAVTDGRVVLAQNARAMIELGATYRGSGIPLATIVSLARKALARA
jgi:hypothetical protein